MIARARRGFTLVEVMIVTVIIGVIASISIPTYTTFTYRSKAAERDLVLLMGRLPDAVLAAYEERAPNFLCEHVYELAQAWPEAELVVVPDAGHSVREPGIARELVAAVERMKDRRLK